MMGDVAQRVTSPVLIGRAAEFAQLCTAFERVQAGSPATILIAGEATVGKTRLVTELARWVRAQTGLVLAGGCLDVGEGVVPYAALAGAARSLRHDVEPDELDRVLDGARTELARLVPDLAASGTRSTGSVSLQ